MITPTVIIRFRHHQCYHVSTGHILTASLTLIMTRKKKTPILHSTWSYSNSTSCLGNIRVNDLSMFAVISLTDHSDEILMIGGLNCPQSVVKFNTKTKQWSDMPVYVYYINKIGLEQAKYLSRHRHTSSCHSIVSLTKVISQQCSSVWS